MNDFQMRSLASDHSQRLRDEADRHRLANSDAPRTRTSAPLRTRRWVRPSTRHYWGGRAPERPIARSAGCDLYESGPWRAGAARAALDQGFLDDFG